MGKLAIFFNFSPTLGHLYPLQVENCDSNSRLVVEKEDNDKFRLERVKTRGLAGVPVVKAGQWSPANFNERSD